MPWAHQLVIVPPDVVGRGGEAAWSSPIWYRPSAETREAALQGLTAANLAKKGGAAVTKEFFKVRGQGLVRWPEFHAAE